MEIDFNLIFASGASMGEIMPYFGNYTTKGTNAEYIRGWGYLGKNVAPPMEDFNYLQQLSDQKDLYLYQTKLDRDELPTSMKNPNSLVIKFDNQNYEYDGSTKQIINIDIATPIEVKAIVV